jgi:hypothetical protein
MHYLLREFEVNFRVDKVNDGRPTSPPPLLMNTIINAFMHGGKFHQMMKNRGNE